MDPMDSNRHTWRWMSLLDGVRGSVVLVVVASNRFRPPYTWGANSAKCCQNGCQIINAMRLEGQLKKILVVDGNRLESRAPPFPLTAG